MLDNEPHRDVLPLPSRIHAALGALAAAGRHREVIEIVELWAASGEPDDRARLFEARALLALRQMERAWTRLKPLLDASPPSLGAYRAAAEHHLLRGWHGKARELLGRALVDHPDEPELRAQWDRSAAADGPPPPPPAPLGALAVEDHLPLAEAYLAAGQVLSARSLLERLTRADPSSIRARDLLWALQGAPPPLGVTLAELVSRASPHEPLLAPTGDDEHTDSITEESRRALAHRADAPPVSPASDGRFPRLFLTSEPEEAEPEERTDEITAARSLSFVSMPDDFEERPTEIDAGGDTRIQRVIDLNRLAPHVSPAVLGNQGARDDDAPEPLDLGLPDPFGANLEDEDDDLVVLTNRRSPILSPPPRFDDDPTASQVGRAVAHLLGPPKRRAPAEPQTPSGEAEDLGAELLDLDPPSDAAPPPRRRVRRTTRAPWIWLAALALVLLIGSALSVALVGVLLLQG